MGINYRSESQNTPNTSKELRYRVWWSIYTVENTLSMMTGRPTSVADRFCTTPLPIPYEEDQFQGSAASRLLSSSSVRLAYMQDFISRKKLRESPSHLSVNRASPVGQGLEFTILDAAPCNSLYFLYFVEITKVLRRATDILYAPGLKKEWFGINEAITEFLNKADAWLSCLPNVFHFKPMQDSKIFERQRWSLAFRFYSLKITVARPSLCRSDRQRSNHGFTTVHQRNATNICFESACDMLDLLPEVPDIVWLARVSPWWCVLHYLMQSVTVLLIELDFCLRFNTGEVSTITTFVEKGMGWLLAMATENIAARRAWDVCHGLYCSMSTSPFSDTDSASYDVLGAFQGKRNGSRAAQVVFQAADAYVPLPQNIVVHPSLQTIYDQFTPWHVDK
ncbi:hypothetical protein FE257_002398 [Aspergillus nanangensis]|uniref:Xylanolytic transcriptional activator regulatory domain-containing protein n=1 Tax=Aspergillus nanangensis TaxID=2582783 RepID=A0AAD4CCM1_ASPNN|nr:hypothetical protein FE257_002398 [Aspergillus nanangensis]